MSHIQQHVCKSLSNFERWADKLSIYWIHGDNGCMIVFEKPCLLISDKQLNFSQNDF